MLCNCKRTWCSLHTLVYSYIISILSNCPLGDTNTRTLIFSIEWQRSILVYWLKILWNFFLFDLQNRRSVLEQHKSNGLDYMGPIKSSLAICVFSVFMLVYFSLWKGVRSAGKVVWVTALAPYVVLFFLLIRGVTLPGAYEGIRYYLTPQWHKLKNSKVCLFLPFPLFLSLSLYLSLF